MFSQLSLIICNNTLISLTVSLSVDNSDHQNHLALLADIVKQNKNNDIYISNILLLKIPQGTQNSRK